MNYLQLQFENLKEAEAEILVALLADAGFESFEEEENLLKAFIKEEDFNKVTLEDILKLVPVKYSVSIVAQQNWNAQWESSFEPIIVGSFVGIRASFHQPIKNVQHEIIITPKMSFGTGHHATTFMMIEQMEALDFNTKSVVDYGTGTAVLAILAEKLGANLIDAIDYDEWSIENSKENVLTNNCSNINLIQADTIPSGNKYDIILANINLNVILNNLDAILSSTKNGSKILFSGFMKADEQTMVNALQKVGIKSLKTIQNGEWICMLTEYSESYSYNN